MLKHAQGPAQEVTKKGPLYPHDRIITKSRTSNIDFTVNDGNNQVDCLLWSERSTGDIEMQPKPSVGVAFNGGTTFCQTEKAAHRKWEAWVNGTQTKLSFKDPLFTVVVGKKSVVRVRRGVVVVTGSSGAQRGVVVGKNLQVSVASGRDPTAPVPATGQTATEVAAVQQAEHSLPKPTDTNAPITTLDRETRPPNPSSLRTATFAFTSEPGAIFSCALDGTDFRLCAGKFQTGVLQPGDHTFAVKATDQAGNVEKRPLTYTWHIDNSRIAFVSSRDGNQEEIYVMDPVADPTGQQATNLTKNPAADADPAWSPDGKRIAFHSTRSGNEDIWVMNADGSSPTQLTKDTAKDTNPTWSPDGKQIAYENDATGGREIYVVNADGTGKPVQLTSNLGLGHDGNFDPAWSPRGDKIAFASTQDGAHAEIYVMNTDGTHQTRLTNDPDYSDFGPAWSPDGSQIAFNSDRNGSSKQIFVMKMDGSSQRSVVSTASDDANPAWAPDGAELVFQGGPPGETDLWIVGISSRNLTRLTYSPGDDMVPDWG